MRQLDRSPINYFEPMVIIIMFNNLWNETFTAWRGMLRRPGFTLLATVLQSLGLANSEQDDDLVSMAS